MSAVPEQVSVRMYQVGFGDCFLLTFGYAEDLDDGRNERHVLIDFGSTRWPKAPKPRFPDIASDIAERTGGKLDVLVITHRHKDHIAALGVADAADQIAALEPSLVLRSWTEDPKIDEEATGPNLVGSDSRRFAASLKTAQEFASEVHKRIDPGVSDVRRDLVELAFDDLANKEAIAKLDALSESASAGGRYLFAGADSGIEALIPGLEVEVLGPPTVDQWPEVASQAEDDPEFWMLGKGALSQMLDSAVLGQVPAAAEAPDQEVVDPGPTRWIVDRLREQHAHSLLRIVRTLDDALNNTSIILLFKVGNRRMLFPGDAQIENWSYSLRPEAEHKDLLAEVDFYKVGHHGSRNATPRSLHALWTDRKFQMTSMMSTLPGVHGESEATAVPRSTLCTALEDVGALFRTDELEPEVPFLELTASTANQEPFTVTKEDG